jgi:hypothetical protein
MYDISKYSAHAEVTDMVIKPNCLLRTFQIQLEQDQRTRITRKEDESTNLCMKTKEQIKEVK